MNPFPWLLGVGCQYCCQGIGHTLTAFAFVASMTLMAACLTLIILILYKQKRKFRIEIILKVCKTKFFLGSSENGNFI